MIVLILLWKKASGEYSVDREYSIVVLGKVLYTCIWEKSGKIQES